MKVRAMVGRLLNQMRRDKRTLALIFVAPMFLLAIIYLILSDAPLDLRVAVINAPEAYVDRLYENNVTAVRMSETEAMEALEIGEVNATINIISGKSYVEMDGSKSNKTNALLMALEASKGTPRTPGADMQTEVRYIYGAEDLSTFDNFGSILIGFIVFFFVFLIAGISFLQERTTGTLEKLLSTPIRRWEIVVGYTLGFGLIALIQSALIAIFVVYLLDVMMVGSIIWVLLITMLSAVTALTLSILLSTAAANEFQMIQFIPIVVVPQVFFAGLFDLTYPWTLIGKFMPLYYVGDALSKVMIKGLGFEEIAFDVAILLGFTLSFMVINTLLLKKHRKI